MKMLTFSLFNWRVSVVSFICSVIKWRYLFELSIFMRSTGCLTQVFSFQLITWTFCAWLFNCVRLVNLICTVIVKKPFHFYLFSCNIAENLNTMMTQTFTDLVAVLLSFRQYAKYSRVGWDFGWVGSHHMEE